METLCLSCIHTGTLLAVLTCRKTFFSIFSSSVGNCKYNNSFMYMQIYIHFYIYIYNCQGCLYVLRANPFVNHIYLRSMRKNRLTNLPFDDEVVKFTFLLVLLRKLFFGPVEKEHMVLV